MLDYTDEVHCTGLYTLGYTDEVHCTGLYMLDYTDEAISPVVSEKKFVNRQHSI
jgi:hypothetical protein